MAMFFDCDTTPPLRSKSLHSIKRLTTAVHTAKMYISDVTEGQIGIYDKYCGSIFYGYVIKYAGQEPYFEAAEDDVE